MSGGSREREFIDAKKLGHSLWKGLSCLEASEKLGDKKSVELSRMMDD